MNQHSKLKYFFGIVFLIIIAVLAYFFYPIKVEEVPYEVLTPSSYEAGTTISLYKNVPPNFPEEILWEEKELDYSGKVETPQGKTQTTVSYISSRSIMEIVNTYSDLLSKNDWQVLMKKSTNNIGIIQSNKGDESVIITVVPKNSSEMLVTIQHEKIIEN